MATADRINLVVAVATAAAAIASAWAAWQARSAAQASRDLIALERERDAARLEREARAVVLDVFFQTGEREDGGQIHLFWARLHNGSSRPITHCRLEVGREGTRWGPVLVGSLAPGFAIIAGGAIEGSGGLKPDHGGMARFTLPGDGSWQVTASGGFEADDDLDGWMARGREYATRPDLTEWERGIIEQPVPGDQQFPPPFDMLAALVEDGIT